MAENFDLIFGQSAGSQYAWSESDYQNGWETVGNTPPTAQQFDALQRRSDLKAQELNNALTPLVNQNTANNRQPLTAYALKDIRYYSDLPTGWYLECSVAGTTDSGAITLPSPIVENATVIDGTVTWRIRKISSADGVPIATILAYSSNGDIPSGYLLCDGSAVSRTMFPDLFAAIGTTYGSGDGSTTFNVPDYNTAERFCQGSTVAGQVKAAGLPNITGSYYASINKHDVNDPQANGAYSTVLRGNADGPASGNELCENYRYTFDASNSNSIYGASNTVQPPALTSRYIIKAFDGQTADSALIDITQYAQELAGKANINGSNMVYHKDVITTSGTYTAPATALYKITVKGGGGGGSAGVVASNYNRSGDGGSEGGTTIAYEHITAGISVAVIVGAGGNNTAGGDSSVTVNGNTHIGGGGGVGSSSGGTGTIIGCLGGRGDEMAHGYAVVGGSGGGAGGGRGNNGAKGSDGTNGGGGGGGSTTSSAVFAGGNGGDGYVWFEYVSAV